VALFGKRKPALARLLLVEDEPLVAFDNEHLLRDAGYTVVATVDRVADALPLIGDGLSLDAVLLDVNLADGSGIDVARAARAVDLPVLLVTGQCPVEAEQLAMGCLAKPYAQRDLLFAIEAIEAVRDGRTPKRLPGGFALFAAR
jgi:DNA-binding response OmpR family regulator